MRKITFFPVLTFLSLLVVVFGLAIATTALTVARIPLGDFRGVTLVAAGIVFVYLYAFGCYRLFLAAFPLQEGDIAEGSRAEWIAHVNILFYLILFNSLIRTHVLPVPLLRLVYAALGARLGANTYVAGTLLDPPLTVMGRNCIVGHDAVLFAHAIEGRNFSLAAIRIGNDVTIGATAVIMSDVSIGDGALISAGAVVTKGTRIGAGEVWGGMPARRLKTPHTKDVEDPSGGADV